MMLGQTVHACVKKGRDDTRVFDGRKTKVTEKQVEYNVGSDCVCARQRRDVRCALRRLENKMGMMLDQSVRVCVRDGMLAVCEEKTKVN